MIVVGHIFTTEFHTYLYFLLLWSGIVDDVEHHSGIRPSIIAKEMHKITVSKNTVVNVRGKHKKIMQILTYKSELPVEMSKSLMFHINEYINKPYVVEWLSWMSDYYYMPRKPVLRDIILYWRGYQFLIQGILISQQMSEINEVRWNDSKNKYHIIFKPSTVQPGGVNKFGVYIPDQQTLGTCGVCSMITMINHEFDKYNMRFSILYLYYTTRVYVMKVPAVEDSGVNLSDVIMAIDKYGLVLESTWPYEIDTFSRKPTIDMVKESKNIMNKYKIKFTRINNTLTDIKKYVDLNKYILADVGFDFDSYLYKTSINKGISPVHRNPRAVYGGYFDHSITICGYNDKTRLIKYINSWGVDFGDNGYGYIPYSYVSDHLVDNIYIVNVSVN